MLQFSKLTAGLLVGSSFIALGSAMPAAAAGSWDCNHARDIALVNGNIVTMGVPAQVSAVVIRDGRIVHLGPRGESQYTPCTKVFDLKGRTAVPGLIDGHIHFMSWGNRPGHDLRLDLATSVRDIQDLVRNRAADTAPGEWITATGGWTTDQLAEKRVPTLAELDAAAPRNPVFVLTPDTLAATNSAGKAFLSAKGVTVGEDGSIPKADNQSKLAYFYLVQMETPASQKRAIQEVMAELARLGVTTVSDMGWGGGNGTPAQAWPSGTLDVYSSYDPLLELWREGKLTTRVRLNFNETNGQPPQLADRLKYLFPAFGDDMLKTLCMAEFITPGRVLPTPDYEEAARAVAKRGWCHEQHTPDVATARHFIDIWEKVNAQYPIGALHWRLAHVHELEATDLERLKALGAGVNVAPAAWLTWPGVSSRGPSYRTIVHSGIHVGAMSDGPNYRPVNPWVHLYLMVTAKDSTGKVGATDQTISRLEAIKLYTADNAWFVNEEDKLGSIEVNKLGDVVVLDRDYFSIPEEDIKKISPVLTVVDGRVVRRTSAVTELRGAAAKYHATEQ